MCPKRHDGGQDVAAEGSTEGVAGRYAAALFDLAKDASKIGDVERDLNGFQKLLDESDDLVRMVRSPVISADDQGKALNAVLAKAGIGGLAANFLQLVTKNRRLFAVPDMIKAFRVFAARDRGEVTAEVASATPLSDAQVTALKATLKATVGKDVTLATQVDPSLLGGLVVKIGSRMVDSSLRTKLQSMKAALSS